MPDQWRSLRLSYRKYGRLPDVARPRGGAEEDFPLPINFSSACNLFFFVWSQERQRRGRCPNNGARRESPKFPHIAAPKCFLTSGRSRGRYSPSACHLYFLCRVRYARSAITLGFGDTEPATLQSDAFKVVVQDSLAAGLDVAASDISILSVELARRLLAESSPPRRLEESVTIDFQVKLDDDSMEMEIIQALTADKTTFIGTFTASLAARAEEEGLAGLEVRSGGNNNLTRTGHFGNKKPPFSEPFLPPWRPARGRRRIAEATTTSHTHDTSETRNHLYWDLFYHLGCARGRQSWQGWRCVVEETRNHTHSWHINDTRSDKLEQHVQRHVQ